MKEEKVNPSVSASKYSNNLIANFLQMVEVTDDYL
jgi:hypothetical protein